MSSDNSTRAAFGALAADMGSRINDPKARLQMTAEQRTTLIAFAESNISPTTSDAEQLRKLALGRVQAQYVAGSLATLDGPKAPSPFKDQDLTRIYQQQQQYMRELQKTLEKEHVRPDRGLDR